MIRRLGKAFLLGLSLWLAVGPLALLQLGAWAWMVTSYSQESSIEQAFRETFGGDHPCEVCRLIDTVEEQQQQGAAQPPGKKEFQGLKLMLGLGRAITMPTPRSYMMDTVSESLQYDSIHQAVPTPPPRGLA